ncbi:thiol-disulfide isomerase/thioredoxin [Bacillus mesophilus]|uniref:Thioredoxin family protein n=1 Tax=Bacillus mesophilus TaxID=1808955 RepID=A0A6M0QEJ3_9BACI|nr:thioredoxin family protein [Bacillus mesophilus]MBM7660073.1 thiol-disulfide isomerase/thioredoxin [Bacillus mesophilus]NEY73728.1 thioredoxin family protein [Bacillus mesophilus]
MKKVIIFLAIIIALFATLAFVTNYSNKQASEGNPYGKSNLKQATISQLDDPNYENQILPDELAQRLADKESLTVYFYSPECAYCRETSPVIVPMTEELGMELPLYNLLEFEEGWKTYQISSTPTLVRYEDGVEVGRVEGKVSDAQFQAWFEQYAE